MNNLNNIDMNKLMEMISKMDKKDLEKGMSQASQIFGKNAVDDLMKKMNQNERN